MRLHSVETSLETAYQTLKQAGLDILRISVVLYDPYMDILRHYSSTGIQIKELKFHEGHMHDSEILLEIRKSAKRHYYQYQAGVIEKSKSEALKILYQHGVRTSITHPLLSNSKFLGFLFFNFAPLEESADLNLLDICSQLIQISLERDQETYDALTRSISMVKNFAEYRDNETAEHLERMSRYSHMIARIIAIREGLSERFVENIFRFAPLHDIGKIAIADNILLKPGPLDDDEFREMKKHTDYGHDMICKVIDTLELTDSVDIAMLKNIIRSHHETPDGTGYPDQLKGNDIPLEARIITVADVFDALVSRRPYKEGWSNEKAFTYLQEHTGTKFDATCVDILLACKEEILEVQKQFQDAI